jgi:hypothetical protein
MRFTSSARQPGGQQQVADEIGSGPHVDGRGLDRHQQQVLRRHAAREVDGAQPGRRIHDDALRVARHA